MTLYRNDSAFGEGIRDALPVVRYEMCQLGNADIPQYILENYPLQEEDKTFIRNYLTRQAESFDEERALTAADRILFSLEKTIGKKINFVLWLASKEAVKELYGGDDSNINAYDVDNAVILSDLGYDGKLFGFEKKLQRKKTPYHMLSKIHSFKLIGISAVPVCVECEVADSGVGIHLVGLADFAVKESLLRTVTALQALGYRIPGKKIVINLAPADLRKDGSGYDLPIALGILTASGQVPDTDLDKYVFAGELGLDGNLRDIPGWLQAAELANSLGKKAVLPTGCAMLAAEVLGPDVPVFGIDNLSEAVSILTQGEPDWTAYDDYLDDSGSKMKASRDSEIHWNDIPGHEGAKRALEIAAAGGHGVLMVGAPGSGKATLAKAMMDILPPLTHDKYLETNRVYSAAGRGTIRYRPFRAPHPTASLTAMLGGGTGNHVRPGEVSLAHNGVLFLNDCADAPKSLMEALRGPLEDKEIKISRLKSVETYPASFLPVFATPPCPCGYYGEGDRCTCTPTQREAFLARLSGPVFDHITVQAWVHPAVPGSESAASAEPSNVVRERVVKARERQMARQGKLNEQLDARELEKITIDGNAREVKELIEKIMLRMNLNVRSYSRMLKIARTIADLDGRDQVTTADIAEAASYRFLDRRTNEH